MPGVMASTHTERLERKAKLYLSSASSEGVPFGLNRHFVKIRREPDTTEEDIVSHVVRKTIVATLWLFLSEVALDGDFGLA